MAGGTTIVDRLNKLSGKDATTIAKALENVEESGVGGGAVNLPSPTTSDNGKVLGVDDSKYKLVEQSGGTVEVSKIKIGTANGGGSTIASGVNSFGGGGTTVDSKTLAEVLGDKTIVSFELIVNGGIATAGECHFMPSGSGTMPVSVLGISGKDAIASEDYTKYLTVNGIVNFGITGSATIDIYAICI